MCVYRTVTRTYIAAETLTCTYIHAHIMSALPFKPGSARRAAHGGSANISRAPCPDPARRVREDGRRTVRSAARPRMRRNPFHPRLKTPKPRAVPLRATAPARHLPRPRYRPEPVPINPRNQKRGRPVSRCAPSRLLVAHDAVVHDLVPPDVPARIARDGEAVALLPVYRVVGGTRLRHGANHLRR